MADREDLSKALTHETRRLRTSPTDLDTFKQRVQDRAEVNRTNRMRWEAEDQRAKRISENLTLETLKPGDAYLPRHLRDQGNKP